MELLTYLGAPPALAAPPPKMSLAVGVYVELKHLGDDKRKILITSENMDLLEEIEND